MHKPAEVEACPANNNGHIAALQGSAQPLETFTGDCTYKRSPVHEQHRLKYAPQ